jgi:hypothetical protein
MHARGLSPLFPHSGTPSLRIWSTCASSRLKSGTSRRIRPKEFSLNKGLENPEQLRQTLTEVTDRFASFEVQELNVYVGFPRRCP